MLGHSTNYRCRLSDPENDIEFDSDTDTDYDSDYSSSSSSSATPSPSPSPSPSPIPQETQHTKPSTPLIHIISYSHSLATAHGSPHIPHRILYHIDCCHLLPPPRRLCHRYMGTDPALAASFFSFPDNERAFQDAVADIWGLLHEPGGRKKGVGVLGGNVAVMVRCKAGMHRSVAMAERVGREIAGWGWRAVVEHKDLGFRVAERREKRERERQRRRRRELRAEMRGMRSEHSSGGRISGYGGSDYW